MPTLDETKAYFDGAASDLVRENLVDKWSVIAGLLGPREPGTRILECGAGTGLYTLPMLTNGCQVTSIDLSQGSLNELQVSVEKHPDLDSQKLRVICGDFLSAATSLSKPYDVVTFFKVLHHFPDRDYIRNAIRRAFDLIGPGGRIVGFEPNGSCPLWWLQYRVFGSKESWENERNLLLIRKRFLEDIFAELPDSSATLNYRYMIPGSIVNRWPGLSIVDRPLCRLAPLNRLAVNLSFIIEKHCV